jgi:hypothetical protein
MMGSAAEAPWKDSRNRAENPLELGLSEVGGEDLDSRNRSVLMHH